MRIPVCLSVVLLLLLASCDGDKPQGVISRSRMTDILYDYHWAQSVAAQENDSNAIKASLYTNAVLGKHGITKAEFDSSMVWYSRNNDVLFDIYKDVNKRYERAISDLGDHFTGAQGGTANAYNIWSGGSSYMLSPVYTNNRLSFSIPTDTLIKPGDRLEFSFNTRFIYQAGTRAVVVVLAQRFANDSVSSTSLRFFGDGRQTMNLHIGSTTPKEIFGLIYLDEPLTEEVKLFVIDDITLIRHAGEVPKTATEPPTTPIPPIEEIRLDDEPQEL